VKVQDDTAEFLARLRGLDISLRLENSRLRVYAPKNVLTPELRAELASRKTDILTFLSESVSASWSETTTMDRVPREGPLPMSFAQSRLWFLDQLTPGSTAYTFPMYTRLRGLLDVGILERTLSEIVRRHEILRTIFPTVDGSPNQVILPPSSVVIPVLDLSDIPVADRESKALQVAATEIKLPFDLTRGPLLRPRLLRLTAEEHVFLISVHHIVFDGSSIDVFWRELSSLYSAFRAGEASPLHEPPFQYVDFASWQKRSLEGPARKSHLEYWKKQLGENPPTLELPADHPRESSGNVRGAKKALDLSSSVSASLKTLSQHEGVSLSMTLLTAFNVLLHRWTGQDDILVGMPVARRNRAEFESMVGIFLNTIVVRTHFPRSVSFHDVLAQVRNIMLDAHEHQDMPFEELVGAIEPQREFHRTPLFQVFFNHLNMQLTPVQITGLQVEPFGEFEVESKFDLSLYLYERNDSISLMLVYSPQLFEESRMATLLEQYAKLLEQICDDPLRTIEEYSLITETATKNARFPDPTAPMKNPWNGLVHSRFLQQSAETPDQIAVVDHHAKWTYAQMASLSSGLSEWLRGRGVSPGDTVAVYGHRSAPLVLALLGILRAGAAFCILDPAYPSSGLAKRLRIVRPKAWLQVKAAGTASEDLEAAIAETAGDCRLTLPETPDASFPAPSLRTDAAQQDETDRPAYVTFTSGTTGEPKCIVGTHGPLSHFLDWHVGQFRLSSSDRFSMLSGLSHDPLLRDIFTPLWIGATLLIPSPDDILSPGRLSAWMEQQQITVAHLTPAMGALMSQPAGAQRKPFKSLSKLRYAFFGGDALSSKDVVLFTGIAPQARCISFYGATETPQAMAWCDAGGRTVDSGSSVSPDSAAFSGQIPIGSPITDVQILVLNRARSLAGIGELGEIHVRTHCLSQGYANDEALTRERFPINPFTGDAGDRLYRTGDLGRYRTDGIVEFAGRVDQQVKLRGYRIELGEIEVALEKHPGIRNCVVVAEESSSEKKILVAYFLAQGENELSSASLREHLAKFLPDYQIPSEYHALASIPLTPNGKIDRRALASGKYRLPSSKASVPPRDQAEATMADIWKQVLQVEKIGVFDNFFELGGHSLAATRLMAQLGDAFGIDIPLQSLFLEPTIAGLAEHLQYDATNRTYRYVNTIPSYKCIVAAQPRGTRIPLFFAGGYQDRDDALLVLSRFIAYLGPDQPVFGFRPRWIESAGEPYGSVEEAAREFLTELRTIQPQGPYLLGGYCVGGVVALETARQLIQEGNEVSLLALLDSERPTSFRAAFAELRLMWRRMAHMARVLEGLVRGRGATRKTAIRDLIRPKLHSKGSEQSSTPMDNNFYDNKVGYRRLAYSHSINEYPGRITLFVNDLQYRFDKYMGWKGVARGGLTVHKVPGDHHTMLRVHGKEFGELLLKCLNEVTVTPPQHAAESPGGQS
jgi:amino acid adenylation domain-containing protein